MGERCDVGGIILLDENSGVFEGQAENAVRLRSGDVRKQQALRRIGKPMNEFTKTQVVVAWICRIAAAAILLQTLFFKFTGAPESVYIFTKVGIEPWGRIGSGVAELIAAILLLIPGLVWLGAALALGVMGGAILSHLTLLDIEVQGDHGLLFGLAVVVAVCSAVVLFLYRRTISIVGNLLLK
jgi:putative oxidoreductase